MLKETFIITYFYILEFFITIKPEVFNSLNLD